jgi:hypothetical protein
MTTFESRMEILVSNGTLGAAWEDLSELADYRKIHGHCNVPPLQRKLRWVVGQNQRNQYSCTEKERHRHDTSESGMESLDFEWITRHRLGGRLSELADYRKIHGTAMFLNYSENIQLGSGSQAKVQLQAAPRRKEIIA